jgi:hypothetical protein
MRFGGLVVGQEPALHFGFCMGNPDGSGPMLRCLFTRKMGDFARGEQLRFVEFAGLHLG